MTPLRTSACLVLLFAAAAAATPSDFMIDLPQPWTVTIDLPRVVPSQGREPPPESGAMEASARQLRDAALVAYGEQQYTQTVALLDRMEATAPLPPSLRVLRAWCASFSGQHEQAASFWSELTSAATNQATYAYMAGWHHARLGLYRDAVMDAQRGLAASPRDRDLLHLAGIASWGAGRRPAAQRYLVQAMRAPTPLAESFLAMAALQVEDGDLATGIGWLKKGLALLPPDHRAAWLVRAEFNDLWTRSRSATWDALLAEFGLPTERADLLRDASGTEPARNRPEVAATRPAAPEAALMLRLSEFPTNITDRMDAIRLHQFALMMKRLQAEVPEQQSWAPPTAVPIPPAAELPLP